MVILFEIFFCIYILKIVTKIFQELEGKEFGVFMLFLVNVFVNFFFFKMQ